MTTNLELIRARLAAVNPKLTVVSKNGSDRWFSVILDDQIVGNIEGELRGIGRHAPSPDGQWTLEGPKVPKLGNKVYGNG